MAETLQQQKENLDTQISSLENQASELERLGREQDNFQQYKGQFNIITNELQSLYMKQAELNKAIERNYSQEYYAAKQAEIDRAFDIQQIQQIEREYAAQAQTPGTAAYQREQEILAAQQPTIAQLPVREEIPTGPYLGPTRPSTDVEQFRQTGVSVPYATDQFGQPIAQAPMTASQFQTLVTPTPQQEQLYSQTIKSRETGVSEGSYSPQETLDKERIGLIGRVDKYLDKPIETKYYEEQLGTQQINPLTGQPQRFYREVEGQITRGDVIKPVAQTLAFPAQVVEFGLAGSADLTRQVLLAPKDIEKARAEGYTISGLGLASEKQIQVYTPQFGTQQVDPITGELLTSYEQINVSTFAADVPKIIGGGKYLAYAIPYVGSALIVSEVAGSGVKYIDAEKEANKIVKQAYVDYKTDTKLEEGERLLTEKEFREEVKPEIIKEIKKSSLIEGGIGLGSLALMAGINKVISRLTKVPKAELNSYKQALKDYEELSKLSKTAQRTTVEKPIERIGVVQGGDSLKGVIPESMRKQVISFEMSQSTQKIIQKVPKIEKINVPKTSKLYKTQKVVYQTKVVDRVIYKNNLFFSLQLKNGVNKTFSIVSYTNKPLSRFRSLANALKYARGKRLIVSEEVSEGMILSEVGKVNKKGKFVKESTFISKVKSKQVQSDVGQETISFFETRKLPFQKRRKTGLSILDPEQDFFFGNLAGRGVQRTRVTPSTGRQQISSVLAKQGDESLGLIISKDVPTKRVVSKTITKGEKPIIETSVIKRGLSRQEKMMELIGKTERKQVIKAQKQLKKERLREKPEMELVMGEGKVAQVQKVPKTQVRPDIKQAVETLPYKPTFRKVIPKPPQPRVRVRTKLRPTQVSVPASLSKLNTEFKQDLEKDKFVLGTDTIETVKLGDAVNPLFDSKQDTLQTQAFVPVNISEQTLVPPKRVQQDFTPPGSFFPREPGIEKPKPKPPEPPLYLPGEKPEIVQEQGWNVEVKRKNKFEKINPIPLTEQSALSMGAREVDSSSSAQFRLQKAQKNVQVTQNLFGKFNKIMAKKGDKMKSKVLDTKDKYFQEEREKFRGYKIRKGKKVTMPKQYIEKKKYRIDTGGEKRGITQKGIQATIFKRRM